MQFETFDVIYNTYSVLRFSEAVVPHYELHLIFKLMDDKEKGSRWATKYSFLRVYLRDKTPLSESDILMENLVKCATAPEE